MEQATRTQKQASRPFEMDVKAIRAKARKDIESGAVTDTYRADRQTVLKLLNEALATEIVCVLRYKRHYFMARGSTPSPWRQSSPNTPRRNRSTPTDCRNASCSWAANPTCRPRACLSAATPSTSKADRWKT